jgi:hypothetical protein
MIVTPSDLGEDIQRSTMIYTIPNNVQQFEIMPAPMSRILEYFRLCFVKQQQGPAQGSSQISVTN